jgi:hypothetical protein
MRLLQAITDRLPSIETRTVHEIEREIDEELNFHLEMRARDHIRDGMSDEEAHSAALRQFGDLRQVQKECRRTLLGERIMWQRVQVGLMFLLLAGGAWFGYRLYLMQYANNAGMELLIQSLGDAEADPRPQTAIQAESTYAKISPDSPFVVATFPEQRDTKVDPATSEIRVTFNKRMLDRSWSWCRVEGAAYPEVKSGPHYSEDGKTCTLPVILRPGTRYLVRFNSESHDNFQDEELRPAVPYVLVFETRRE